MKMRVKWCTNQYSSGVDTYIYCVKYMSNFIKWSCISRLWIIYDLESLDFHVLECVARQSLRDRQNWTKKHPKKFTNKLEQRNHEPFIRSESYQRLWRDWLNAIHTRYGGAASSCRANVCEFSFVISGYTIPFDTSQRQHPEHWWLVRDCTTNMFATGGIWSWMD